MKNTTAKIAVAILLLAFCISSSFVWWQHNRMRTYCFALGIWGDTGPGQNAHIKRISREGIYNSINRIADLLKHSKIGRCASLDEKKYWEDVEKKSEELDWPEAHYMLSLKYGYDYDPYDAFDKSVYVEYDKEKMREQKERYWFDYSTGVYKNRGDGKDLDLEKSFALMKKSAKGGYNHAYNLLSYAYHIGEWGKDGGLKIAVDPYQSLEYMEEWAKGDARGAFHAGYRYRYGEDYGIESNYDKAHDYFIKVAAHSTGTMAVDAMVELAIMYEKGIGVEQDNEKALEWINKATEIAKDEQDKKYIERYLSESNIRQ